MGSNATSSTAAATTEAAGVGTTPLPRGGFDGERGAIGPKIVYFLSDADRLSGLAPSLPLAPVRGPGLPEPLDRRVDPLCAQVLSPRLVRSGFLETLVADHGICGRVLGPHAPVQLGAGGQLCKSWSTDRSARACGVGNCTRDVRPLRARRPRGDLGDPGDHESTGFKDKDDRHVGVEQYRDMKKIFFGPRYVSHWCRWTSSERNVLKRLHARISFAC